jgi:hypothetical protein
MRLRLSFSTVEGTCSACGASPVAVTSFVITGEDHAGEAEPLCQVCFAGEGGLSADVPMLPLAAGPPDRRKAFRKAKKVSNAQEVDIAAELGGRTQPGSGNQPGAKGDVRVRGEYRGEAKFTFAGSFSLKLEELYKIAGECGDGEKPIFVIDFREQGTRKLKDRFAVLHFHDLKEIVHGARQHR